MRWFDSMCFWAMDRPKLSVFLFAAWSLFMLSLGTGAS